MQTLHLLKDFRPGHAYAVAVLAPSLCALLASPLLGSLDLVNIVMLFLLVVVVVAALFGRGPAILATVISVGTFDFAFVPPRFSFTVADGQYLITFTVMLLTGLLIAQTTSLLRQEAKLARFREAQSHALYEFAKDLSGTLEREQIAEITQRYILQMFAADSALLLPNDNGRLSIDAAYPSGVLRKIHLGVLEIGLAQWALDHASPGGAGAAMMMPTSRFLFVPLVTPSRPHGILALALDITQKVPSLDESQQLKISGALVAIALERLYYIDAAQSAMLDAESQRLRNALLAALSHDIRTPLTSMVGLAETLARSSPSLSREQQDLASAVHGEALRMSNLATSLLDMARLQSGQVQLNLQWHALEEVVGSALRSMSPVLKQHVIQTDIPVDLPLVHLDAVLIERVICNLLENAAKYSPSRSQISISAVVVDDMLQVTVRDAGPGLPKGQEEHIFQKFVRGERESASTGVGLGLALCRAILDAHHGSIEATNDPLGGARFVFRLPLGTPPSVPEPETDMYAMPNMHSGMV